MNRKFLLILLLTFLILTGVSYFLQSAYPDFPLPVLLVGNTAIGLITMVSYLLAAAKMQARPQAFVGGVTGASLLKMVVLIGLVLVYVLGFKAYYHKGAVFVLLAFYAVYAGVETVFLSRLAKQKP